MLDAIQNGIFTSSTKQRLQELEARKEDLEISIAQEQMFKPLLEPKKIKFFLHQFRKLDTTKLEHRCSLIDNFVNAVFLHDDRIDFVFNYQKGTKTVTFKELEEASEGSSDLIVSARPKIDKFRQRLVDFTFSLLILHFSLFSFETCRLGNK